MFSATMALVVSIKASADVVCGDVFFPVALGQAQFGARRLECFDCRSVADGIGSEYKDKMCRALRYSVNASSRVLARPLSSGQLLDWRSEGEPASLRAKFPAIL
jgi:hypothetical protein